jgi:hypothetical protein
MPSPKTPEQVRADFAEAVAKERHDVLFGAVIVVAITALAVSLGAVVLTATAGSARGPAARDIPAVLLAALAYVLIAFVVSNKTGRPSWGWVGGAAALLALLAAAGLASALPVDAPGLYWTMYAVFALAALGCLGMAYQPRDDYYLGWNVGPGIVNNPFTFRDDVDRMHLFVGLVTALPRMLVGSFVDLAGSAWVRKGLSAAECQAGGDMLFILGTIDPAGAEKALRRLGPGSASQIALWLTRMKLVRRSEAGWMLSTDGERLVGRSEWY